jgi:four helix bundle protein
MFRFEKLLVWQKAVVFANEIYAMTRGFPNDERFGLTSQMRRAAVSISANIAEGSSRTSDKDFIRFVEIAYGSLMEVVSLAEVAHCQDFLAEKDQQTARGKAEELARMLSGLRSSLMQKQK